jgi:hypothetical protein
VSHYSLPGITVRGFAHERFAAPVRAAEPSARFQTLRVVADLTDVTVECHAFSAVLWWSLAEGFDCVGDDSGDTVVDCVPDACSTVRVDTSAYFVELFGGKGLVLL